MSDTTKWIGTAKRVPLVFSQLIAALGNAQFQITPQFAFRGENLIVDPLIAASVQVQPITVGPNVQVAGGSNTANMSGQMFPPTQTACLDFGMDIANQGNQLTLVATSTLTSTSVTFTALLMGTIASEMTPAQAQQHAKAVQAGIMPAGNFVRGGIAPAGSFTRA